MVYKRTLTIGAILVAVVAILGLASVTLAASGQTGSNKPHNIFNKEKRQEQAQQRDAKFEAAQKALEQSDYQAWLKAIGPDSAQAKVITADKFPQLVEAYKLTKEGRAKFEQARQIREALGLKPKSGEARNLRSLPGIEKPADINK
jgi:hypothetical protein